MSVLDYCVQQWSPTPELWTRTGPWVIWYRAAQTESTNSHNFCFIFDSERMFYDVDDYVFPKGAALAGYHIIHHH